MAYSLPTLALLGFVACSVPCTGVAQQKSDKQKDIFKKVTGKDADELSSFLTDRGAASIAAAAMAGVGASSMTVVEDSKDFAILLSPFTGEGKGGGFAIAPARIRHPLPKINLMTEYVASAWWRAVAALNISGAQGTTDIDGTNFRRRAFAVSTSGYFYRDDDPIVFRALRTRATVDGKGNTCADKYFAKLGDLTGEETSVGGTVKPASADEAELKTCIANVEAEAKAKWFLPRWSLAIGTGDARPSDGGDTVRTGTVVAAGVTYGRAWRTSSRSDAIAAPTEPYGWAVSVIARHSLNEVVLKSLLTSSIVRQNSTLVSGRAVMGTEGWRLLTEASNNKIKQTDGGKSPCSARSASTIASPRIRG